MSFLVAVSQVALLAPVRAQSEPGGRLAAAVALFEQEQFSEARTAFIAILDEFDTPENRTNVEFDSLLAGSRYYLGEISLGEDKHLEAIGHYQEVVDSFRSYRLESLYHMGLARYYLKEYQTAIGILGDLATQNPSSTQAPQSLFYEATCCELLKDKPAAKAVFQQMIDRYPQHAWTKKAREKVKE
jgi:TolA-binding protein